MSESLLIIIPAFNEASRLGPVVQGAAAQLPVLVVDDGSTDDTARVAKSAGARVLRQQPNQGKGAALQAGFQSALEQGCQAVITLDADGQHDPAEIPKFIQLYQSSSADLIIGSRDFSRMPPLRRLANWLGRGSFSWALGQPVLDNQSGFRLISQRLLADLLGSQESGFEFEVEMIVTCVRQGYLLQWLPIRTIYAGESSHINPWLHTRNFIRLLLRTRRTR